MVFSNVNSNDFFPKTKLVSQVDELDLNFVGDRYDVQYADEDEETM